MTKAVEYALDVRERAAKSEAYFWDLPLWAHDIAGVDLWSKQREIAADLAENKNVAVKAGHGVGKSLMAAVMICWWVDTRYPNCFVASTAPSVSQIGAILWREIRKLVAQIETRYKKGLIDHKLPGTINTDNRNNEWKADSGQLIGFGRKPPDEKVDDAFQGIHDAAVLAIGDEAVGLSLEMIDALGNITSNEHSRRLLIANPTNPASYFGKLFKEQPDSWKFHTISVFDSPNFTDEHKTMDPAVLEKLTGPTYVEDKKKEYGENSARYKARVLGEFAFDLGDTLIQPTDLAIADDTEIVPSTDADVRLGVDVAAMGEDFSVVYSFHGGVLRFVDSWSKCDAEQSAEKIKKAALRTGAKEVRIDAGGFGGAVADIVTNAADGLYTVIKMWGSAASPDKRQWLNARAFWWDKFRSMARSKELDIDPLDETLHDELMSVEYKIAPGQGIQIESKDDMRRRGFKSPDFADSAIYAAADLSNVVESRFKGLNPGDELLMNLEVFEDSWMNAFDW